MLPEHFVVVDLETTGLSPAMHEIIEIGAIRVHRDSDQHDTFHALVKPQKKIPPQITELTGISQDMIDCEGDVLSVALADFIEFIQDLPLVAFNATFDMNFLYNAASRNGLAIRNRYTCALKLSRRAWPGLNSYRLSDLATMGNLSNQNPHRALADCERTIVVFAGAVSTIGKKIRWTHPTASN